MHFLDDRPADHAVDAQLPMLRFEGRLLKAWKYPAQLPSQSSAGDVYHIDLSFPHE